jgi:4'-phosphopantetheinyl transferase
LTPGVVHVWCLPLDLAAAPVEELRTCLSADEVDRAARYHFDRHRRRFIACRGQVRKILAAYLGAKPGEIRFAYGLREKPVLKAPWNDSAIQFNVSNSHETALLALALDRELGVDVEHVREPSDFDGLAAQFFARSEVDQLRSLPETQRLEAFFNCWTRKEAVLKAVGTGLSFPLDKVVVTLAPDEPARLVAYDDDPAAPAHWWLASLAPAAGYIGALAVPGGPLEMHCWQSR